MGAVAVPIVRMDVWEAWVADLNGPRKAEFDDMNQRHGISAHRAWLQQTPDGQHLAIVVIDGPGADEAMGKIMKSDHEFDRWFREQIAEAHAMDLSAGPPPAPEQRL